MYKNKNDNFNDRKKKFDGYKDDFSERENQNEKDIIFGRNSVQEAIKAGRPLDSVMVARGERSGSVPKILADAKNAGVPIKEVDRKKLDFLCGHANHQGVIAMGAVKAYSTVDDIFAKAEEKGEPPFIIVCDEIEDPHNLGAIIRTAECVGAHGVIIPKRRSAGLTTIVDKASAGAAEHMMISRVPNISAALKELKDEGLWVYGTAADGQNGLWTTDLTGPVALVIGSEGDGMGRLVKENCDFVLSLPMKGRLNSLNASAAAAVTMYEVLRQRSK